MPHAPNAADSFDNTIIDAGEAKLYRGFFFYRKHITLTAAQVTQHKLFLEFEAVRQTIYLYVNGKKAGYYEAGITATGFDITGFVHEGENVIAIATDNCASRHTGFRNKAHVAQELPQDASVTRETVPGHEMGDASGAEYQWNAKDFNEIQGGITGNVRLHVKPLVYQTLPLYSNLRTTGTCVTAHDFYLAEGTAVIAVDCEVRNESKKDVQAVVSVTVEDSDGTVHASFEREAVIPAAADAAESGAAGKTGSAKNNAARPCLTVVPADAYSENPAHLSCATCAVTHVTLSGTGSALQFWSPNTPHLYRVQVTLRTENGECDTETIVTGFRSVTYDEKKGGLLINEKPVYLSGYAQRSTNEWAVIGVASDWLTDDDMRLVRESNANYIRWMHVAPKPAAIRACDKYGVISVCPAGDKEGETQGRQWAQRMEAMRDTIIYFRNAPSVIFWEAGNAAISAAHMQEMTTLKQKLDPAGGRFMGCRSLSTPEQLKAAEWVGTMIWRYDTSAKKAMRAIGKHLPMLETEFKRDESPRRVWDDFTPPDYDYKNRWLGDGGKKTDGFDIWDETQEDHIRSLASNDDGYGYFWNNRVGGITKNDYYTGAAMMVWSDSNMHGRNSGSENCRTSGRVDPVRIKKESFYALQVMQSRVHKIHLVGHWNYPALTDSTYWYEEKRWNGSWWEPTGKRLQRNPKDKTVYVVATPGIARVDLFINSKKAGTATEVTDSFIFAFPHIDVTQSGTVEARAYLKDGTLAATDRRATVGEAHALTLTAVTGPEGLLADGSDIAFVDVAVTDRAGRICPTASMRIDFTLSGDGVFLGGYNSGKCDDESVIGKSYCFAECGTNRVFIRTKRSEHAGLITLTARAGSLAEATLTLTTVPVATAGGLCVQAPQARSVNACTFLPPEAALRTAPYSLCPIDAHPENHSRETYGVRVNGRGISFAEPPYRPDSTTGVLAELRTVLDKLKEAGADFSYHYQTAGELPPYLASFRLPLLTILPGSTSSVQRIDIVCGETAIIVDGGADKNLTGAEFYTTAQGELVAELAPVLGYIAGVSMRTDAEKHSFEITTQEE